MHTAVPYAAAARASAGRRLRHSILVARCFSLFFDCFIAANKRQPLPGIPNKVLSQGYLERARSYKASIAIAGGLAQHTA